MKTITSTFIICMLLNTASTFAQPGTLDSNFGVNGTLIGPKGGGSSVAIQADAKIILAGGAYNYSSMNYDFALIRCMPDGTIDSTFGSKGKGVTDFGGDDVGYSVAIQADGKIIVEGNSYNGSKYNFALVRFKQNGRVDTVFGDKGKVIIDFGGLWDGYSDYNCVAIQADGKIVVAGSTGSSSNGSDFDFALARYLQNGKPDSTFGVGGKVISGFSSYDIGYAVAIQEDGKIVVAGISNANLALLRYLENGKIDKSFGNNGRSLTDFGGRAYGNSIAIQADGKIVVAGYSTDCNTCVPTNFAMARYMQDGKPDSAFGGDGKVITNLGYDDYGQSVAIQTNGKIVVAGYSENGNAGSYRPVALVRYRPNGKIDTAFGTNGRVLTSFGSKTIARAYSVVIQTDGKIVVGGSIGNFFGVLRYNNASAPTNGKEIFLNLHEKSFGKSTNIHLSPNPVKDILRIEGLSSFAAKTIFVVDITGKLLQTTVTSNAVYSFNVKQLNAGIYFIRINEGEKIITLKFVKE